MVNARSGWKFIIIIIIIIVYLVLAAEKLD